MPRLPTGIYEQPFPDVVPDTTIESAVYNGFVNDVETDLNAPRPIVAGGTGASNADDALKNVSAEKAAQLVASYDSHLWFPGSFRSAAAAAGAPNATSTFVGTAFINEPLANPPTNQNVVIEARDQNDTGYVPGRTYVREKKAGTWGAWTGGIYAAPFDAMAYNGMQVNGSMEVSQEVGTAGVTITNGNTPYVLDAWFGYSNNAAARSINMQQITPPGAAPFGYALQNCLQIKAVAGGSYAALNDMVLLYQRIEGYRTARLGFGFAGAQSVTVGFWVYASMAGTLAFFVQNGPAINRSYVVNVVVNAPGTWEYKTVTIPGDVTGTWGTINTAGFHIGFCVTGSPSNVASANTWTTGNAICTAATSNFMATTNNIVCLTGVVVLPGTQAPTAAQSPLIMRPYDQELMTCQRYYRWIGFNMVFTSPSGGAQIQLPVHYSMRAAPTMSAPTIDPGATEVTAVNFTGSGITNITPSSASMYVTSGAPGVVALLGHRVSADARL